MEKYLTKLESSYKRCSKNSLVALIKAEGTDVIEVDNQAYL